MEQLQLSNTEIIPIDTKQNEQSTSSKFTDIFDKYDLNETEKSAIELKLFERMDYKQVATKLSVTPSHASRVLNTPKVKDCIAELKEVLFQDGMNELTEIAYSEAVRLLKDKDTPVKQRVELIRHLLPEGKRNIDLNVGQQGLKNW